MTTEVVGAKEKTDFERMLAIIQENSSHAYLATTDGDQPVLRSMAPIIEDDGTMWVTTFKNSRKIKHIMNNPKICLAFIEQPQGDKVATVIGEAQIIESMDLKQKVWKLAPFDLGEYFPKGPESDEYCLLKININKVEWRDSWSSKINTYQP